MRHILPTNHFIFQFSKSNFCKFLLIVLCLSFQVSHLAFGISNKSKIFIPTTTTVNPLPTICSSETAVILSATVSPDPEGGSVQFQIDGANVGTAVSVLSGVASMNYDGSALTHGNHVVKAIFNGNGSFTTSTSPDAILSVNGVNPGLIAKGASAPGPACSSLNPNVTLVPNGTTSIAATGNGTITYIWQQSIDGGLTWTEPEGTATLPSNTSVQFNPKSMTTTTKLRRVATSTLNSIACMAYSNELEYIVYQAPIVASIIASTYNVCEGSTLQLTNATPGGVWSSNNFESVTIDASGLVKGISASASSSSNVSYKVTDGNGCSKNVNRTIAVRALPEVTSRTLVCNGEVFNLSPGSAGTWISNNTAVATVTNAGLVTAIATGTVSFTFTNNTAPRCANTTSLTTVSTSPLAQITSENFEICTGQPATIKGNVTAIGNWTVTLNDGSTATGRDNGTFEITVNPVSNQNYKITSLSSSSCNAKAVDLTGVTSVIIKSIPATPIINIVDHCNETSTLTASNYTGSLLWSTNETTESITVSMAGNYLVTQTINGCTSNSGSVAANPKVAPIVPVVTSPIAYCKGNTAIQLIASGTDLLWYETQTEGTGNNTAPIPQTSVQGVTSYYVSQTVNGCESERAIITVNVNDDCGSMPVTLVEFSVRNSENAVLLAWKTTSEINSSRFEIERSSNPVKGFTKIISVSSKNNELGGNYNYTDFDISPDNMIYYRLKMVDWDETFAYSKIQQIKLNNNIPATVLYPNPVSQYLNIETDDWVNVTGIKIYNMNGSLIYELSGDQLIHKLEINKLLSNSYIIEITRKNGKKELSRFMVTH